MSLGCAIVLGWVLFVFLYGGIFARKLQYLFSIFLDEEHWNIDFNVVDYPRDYDISGV